MARKKKILTIAGGLILIAVIGTGVYFEQERQKQTIQSWLMSIGFPL